MHARIAKWAVPAFMLALAAVQGASADEAPRTPEDVMTRFLKAFVAYDYETCRSLLAPGASMAITRRYYGEPYVHVYQDANKWLDEVGESGVKELKDFSVDIHETASLMHGHGATVVLRFTASGGASYGQFQSLGFDTGSLIDTPEGWRILHYSSFEEFRGRQAAAAANE